jgi:hypothetical protein
MMATWKGWTAKDRNASAIKSKKAITDGIIPPPTKCNRCGQTEGVIEYHNADYSDPIKYLEQLCKHCHLNLHMEERNPAAARRYWEWISQGNRRLPFKKAVRNYK